MEIKQRKYWIDIAKGIGIVFVMLGHTFIGKTITGYTYVFNLPTFIFVSGYLFNFKKYTNFKHFFTTRAKSILIPYIGLSIISIVFYKFYFNMPLYDYKTIGNMAIVFLTGIRNQIFYNIPLWFLPTLFFIEIAFYLIRKINNKYLEIALIILLSSFFVLKWNTLYNPKLFWTIDTGLFYLLFFALGYYIRNEIFKLKLSKITQNLLFVLALIINTLPIYAKSIYEYIFKSSTGVIYYIALTLTALIGIYVVIKISQMLKRNRILEFIGRNSITFFGLHVLIYWILNKVIKMQINEILLSIIYVVLSIGIITLLIPLLKKIAPDVFGKQLKTSD